MTDHLPILRRVGWLLIVLGVLDIGALIYCIANQISYASSLNVFAVAAGIFLLRGNLGAVRYVTWSSAFTFSSLLTLIVVLPELLPVDYWMLIIRRYPFVSVGYLFFTVGFLWMLFWVYRQLRLPAVIEARAAAGHRRGAPTSAFVAGGALVILLAAAVYLALNGEVAQQAKRSAEEQYGRGYHYFVSSFGWNGEHITAEVTAYKQDETRQVEIDLE